MTTSPATPSPSSAAAPAAGGTPVRTLGRSSVDASNLVVALVVLAAAVFAGIVARETAQGVADDLVRLAERLPTVLLSLLVVVSRAGFVLVVVGAPVALLVTGRLRLAGLTMLAAAVAAGAFTAVGYALPALGAAVLGEQGVLDVPGGLRLPVGASVAAYTAGGVVVATEVTRRWGRAVWLTLGLLVASQVLTASGTPLDLVIAITLGVVAGSAVLLAFGRRLEAAGPAQLTRALARAGLVATRVSALDDTAWPGWTLRITTDDGRVLAGRTIGVREQRSDMLHRRYRALRLRDAGDEHPYSSPRRAAAVEAAMTLLAARHGVRCPVILAVEPVGAEEFVVVVEHVAGRLLSDLSDAELTPVLVDAWRQVDALHEAGIAHRNLQLDQLLLDDDGAVWLRDISLGEPAATTSALEADTVEMLAGTYVRLGAEAAVAAATQVLDPSELSGALSRLVPASLTRPTRAAVKARGGGLDPLVDELGRVTGISEPVFAQVERVSVRTLVIGATVAIAIYLLLPQLADLPTTIEAVREADWKWVIPVAAASLVTYVGAAMGLVGGTPGRVPLWQAFLVSLSSSSVAIVAPGAIGQVGLNTRFLRQRGYSMSVSVSASVAKETAMFVVHVLLLASFAVWAGNNGVLAGEWSRLPPAGTLLAIGGGVLGLLGLLVALPGVRRWWRSTVVPAARDAWSAMSQVAASPSKMMTLFSGVALVPLGYAVCLYFSVEAFGGGAAFAAVALLYLSVGAIAYAAPTPGGLGAVEAVLVASLVGIGVPSGQALAAVFLFRLATFWLPLPPSFLAFRWLTARHVV